MNLFTICGLLKAVSYCHVLHSVRETLRLLAAPFSLETELKLAALDSQVG